MFWLGPGTRGIRGCMLVASLAVYLTVSLAVSMPALASPVLFELTAHRADVPAFARAAVQVKPLTRGFGFATLLRRHAPGTAARGFEVSPEGFVEGVDDALRMPFGEVFSAVVVFRSAAAARRRMSVWADESQFLFDRGVAGAPVPMVPGSEVLAVAPRFPAEPSADRVVFFSVGGCAVLESVRYTGFEAVGHLVGDARIAAAALYARARSVCP